MTVTTNNAAATRKAPATRRASMILAKAKAAKAKAKGPTKAEIERRQNERALASGEKEMARTTLEQARVNFADANKKKQQKCYTYAMHLNNVFSFVLREHKIHWVEVYGSANAKHPDSNLRPIWLMIDAEYDALKALLHGNHSNIAGVWKRAWEKAYAISFPGKKREPRNPKLPADSAMEKLISAYKTVAKETIQSERDERIIRVVGEALIALKVDLQKINEKIG